ncbi:hypothetical protein [Asaia bogorensis]|uniref:Uncharacterized protein n=1 Tax=Asaia bogorensis NBRC 16594 TaxID=1231624 RepID=A0AAN4U3S9_9PROT|nr:hypothetical protein [Asaia bogorensis]GBQ81421.1 hypothetical protein AA0311_2618 [Asaia bogorensis NBRC 16594]GEL54868.1 hypothetical protein ABO01nite_28750 [Asaia bogorensis NBRC 16594]
MNTVEYQTLLEIRNATHRAAQAGKNTVPVELYREQQKELAGAQAYIAALQGQLADTKAQLKTAEDRARLNALNLDIQTENLANSEKLVEELRVYFRPKVARLEEENAALKQQLADKA